MNNDTEFSRVLKEILGCLYTAETKEQKDLFSKLAALG